MREITISNTNVSYPDQLTWLHDNISIVLEANGYGVGANIMVTNTASGQYRKLSHYSELERIVFPLNDTYLSLYTDSDEFNVTIDVYENGVLADSFGFTHKVYNGTSLPLRAHGSARTVYAYDDDDLYKIQMLFPATGHLNVNGNSYSVTNIGIMGFDLRSAVNENGTYPMCYFSGTNPQGTSVNITNIKNITPFSAVAELEFQIGSGVVPDDYKQKGDIWADSKFTSGQYCVNLIYEEACDNFNFFKVRYLDTDGCLRYLGGKIISDTTKASGDNYFRLDTDSVYRNISRKYISESSGTVKVGYTSLRRDSYWNDILLADKVEFLNYNGEWVECSVATDSVTVKSDESEDVTLEFQLFIN